MKKQYILTERAHFMCPNMHFGMRMKIEKEYEEGKVRETLDRMAEAHPFLKALIAYEDGTDKLYYKLTEHSQICLNIKIPIKAGKYECGTCGNREVVKNSTCCEICGCRYGNEIGTFECQV